MQENTISTNTVGQTLGTDSSATVSYPSPKNGGKAKFFVVGCIVLVCCLVGGLVTSVVYAMKSNKNIPFISDIAELVENVVVSEDKQAEMVQEDMVNTVFSALLPFVEDKENNAFFKANFTKEELESIISNEKELNSARYNIDFDFSSPKTGNISISTTGFSKKGDKDNEYESQMTIDAKLKISGVELSAKGEARGLGDIYYVRVNELPAMAEAYSQFQDKWFKINTNDIADLTKMANVKPTTTKSITKEDLDNIKEFITSEEIKKTIKKVNSEVINGVRTNCFEMNFDKKTLPDIINKGHDIFGSDKGDVTSDDIKELEYLNVIMCSDKKDRNLYKLVLESKITPEDDDNIGTMVLKLNMRFWDYNKVEDVVEEPRGAVDIKDFIQDLTEKSRYQGRTKYYKYNDTLDGYNKYYYNNPKDKYNF